MSMSRDRWLADDLAQEAILRAMRSETRFDDREQLRKWLFRVTHNLWIDATRKSVASTNQPLSLREAIDGTDSPDLVVELSEQVEAAFAQMQRLPLAQRQVLYLRVVEEMSVDDVADTLGMTRAAVKTNLSLARKRMREMPQFSDDKCTARKEYE